MTLYTDVMVAELNSRKAWDYAAAEAFAQKYPTLSTRSVVSKIKSLGLDYTPKPKAARKNPQAVRKADVVTAIAAKIGADADKIAGLAKADNRALAELVRCIG